MNDQDLSINDGGDGQKAEHVLEQLEDLAAVSLWMVEVNSQHMAEGRETVRATRLYLVLLHHFFCETISGKKAL